MNFAVDWALKTNYLSIYPGLGAAHNEVRKMKKKRKTQGGNWGEKKRRLPVQLHKFLQRWNKTWTKLCSGWPDPSSRLIFQRHNFTSGLFWRTISVYDERAEFWVACHRNVNSESGQEGQLSWKWPHLVKRAATRANAAAIGDPGADVGSQESREGMAASSGSFSSPVKSVSVKIRCFH